MIEYQTEQQIRFLTAAGRGMPTGAAAAATVSGATATGTGDPINLTTTIKTDPWNGKGADPWADAWASWGKCTGAATGFGSSGVNPFVTNPFTTGSGGAGGSG